MLELVLMEMDTELTLKAAKEVIRDFGYFNPNNETVIVERVPCDWEEFGMLLKAVDALCKDLDKKTGNITTLTVIVTGLLMGPNSVDIAYDYNTFMMNRKVWADTDHQDVMRFTEAFADSCDLYLDECFATVLHYISYNRFWGWHHELNEFEF